MNAEQIRQNAEKYTNSLRLSTENPPSDYHIGIYDGYIAGAHSRDGEVENLENAMHSVNEYCHQLRNKLYQLRNSWISVEDRLPEEDKDNNGYSVKVIGMFASGSISDCFCSLEEDIWFIDIFTCDKPTHWMPIPELKKGE